jgi:hypothetical protein
MKEMEYIKCINKNPLKRKDYISLSKLKGDAF